ncbi:MAG: hypothetical protein AAF446_01485 [Pseudomonadota bacterium]
MRKTLLILTVFALCVATMPARAMSLSGTPSAGSAMSWYLLGFELGPWEAYLAHELTPELPAMQRLQRPQITWLNIDRNIVLPEFARPLFKQSAAPRVNLFTRSMLQTSGLNWNPQGVSGGAFGNSETPFSFDRAMLISGISSNLSARNRISVSAVLASQQFSHSMLDLNHVSNPEFGLPSDFFAMQREISHGSGLLLAFESDLAPRVKMNAAFQSRIDLDELLSVRGLSGASADLDIPSRMQMGFDLRATERTVFTMAVSQVFYSGVGAFPSRALPARFSALLGDSGSPNFAWEDLTVYSFGVRWRNESDLEFSFDFHSRSQPTPDSPRLASALEDELARESYMVGLGKRLSDRTSLNLSASYAPPEFAFGGNVMGVISDDLDQAVEVAARLNFAF